ncbi:S-adenosyl-L-methionine-dependent methyltransferase [Obba rivulosa]|uniref:S-adenosyl-L-methionine-dependent methyltransferase n=1 Tax=Obba rivulosa TaxID=1052685 RepID=A0A8E2B0H4_9APHY|nr:S-adenosyl-L-methionine-dependent methyltransferase [Obba rivulosa]
MNATLNAVMTGHVVKILRSSGPNGLSVDEIAAKNNMDAGKLARLLRILATHHTFWEVSPDTFANNRISASLDTGKSFSEIVRDPDDKYTATSGSGALTFMCSSNPFPLFISTCLPEILHDPKLAHSQELTETAFSCAFETDTPFFEWLNVGEPKEVLDGFEWDKLPEGSVIVDVGGGVGTAMQVLYDAHKHLKYIVQDRDPVMADARTFWETHRPEALRSSQVTLQVGDFFAEQPIKNARVFFLRGITHNWPTPHAARILQRLRNAVTPDTQLVLAENIVAYACREHGGSAEVDVPGATPPAGARGAPPELGASRQFYVLA